MFGSAWTGFLLSSAYLSMWHDDFLFTQAWKLELIFLVVPLPPPLNNCSACHFYYIIPFAQLPHSFLNLSTWAEGCLPDLLHSFLCFQFSFHIFPLHKQCFQISPDYVSLDFFKKPSILVHYLIKSPIKWLHVLSPKAFSFICLFLHSIHCSNAQKSYSLMDNKKIYHGISSIW